MTRRGWLLFVAMGVIWGIPYLLIKVAVGDLTPAALVFVRTGIGALVLVPVAASRGLLTLRRWHWVLLYTVVELAVPWLLLSDAERRVTSSLAGLLVAAVPFAGAVIALLLGSDDRIDRRRALGLAVGFAGVAALVGLDLSAGDVRSFLELAVVIVCYATGPVIIARRLRELPPMAVVASSLGVTAILYAPVGILQLPSRWPSPAVLGSMACLGVICTALAFLLFFALIAEVGAVRATVITYVNPAVALLLGVLVLRERLTVAEAVGFVLILAGSVLATRRSAPRGPGSPSPTPAIPAMTASAPASPVGAP